MRVLHLSVCDARGGASRAAYRIHCALVAAGVDSRMRVMQRHSDDWRVYGPATTWGRSLALLWPTLATLPGVMGLRRWRPLATQSVPSFGRLDVPGFEPDLLHLHFIVNGFVRIEALPAVGKPLVWTLHDMWPFTGGCGYSSGCERYREACGCCPLLGSRRRRDLSHRVFRRKVRAWRNLDLHVVGPSRWMTSCAAASALFARRPVTCIPYPIDTQVFQPMDRIVARRLLNLPPDDTYILFSAMHPMQSPYKGWDLLLPALAKFAATRPGPKPTLLVMGCSALPEPVPTAIPCRFMGRISDDVALALHYMAADVFVAPSRQDNLPNTVIESLACGTPVVAFDIGGMPDMIRHRETGHLARPFDTTDLAAGIAWCLDPARREELRRTTRAFAEQQFSPACVSRQYLDVYERALAQGARAAASPAGVARA